MEPGAVATVGAAVLVALGGCAATGTGPSAVSATTPSAVAQAGATPSGLLSADFLPGLRADLRLPTRTGSAPLVVLVPGGGWQSADPTGLVPLAEELTRSGASTATTTYRTTTMGATFPGPVDDVACAVRWSADAAATAGRPPSRIVVLGHSAGGHLAALVALAGDRFGQDCAAPPVRIDGLVGLAGVYDVRALDGALAEFFGTAPAQDADRWNDGDPRWWAESGQSRSDDLRVLLVHGDADTAVPLDQTTTFATALRDAGAGVTVDIVPGQTHLGIFAADVAGPVVEEWLAGWP